jgi:hypothetical protein
MSETDYTLSPLGFLHSPLKSREEAPNQGREGAPDAWLEVNEMVDEVPTPEAGRILSAKEPRNASPPMGETVQSQVLDFDGQDATYIISFR